MTPDYLTDYQKKKLQHLATTEGRPEAEILQEIVSVGLLLRTKQKPTKLKALPALKEYAKSIRQKSIPANVQEEPKKRKGRSKKDH